MATDESSFKIEFKKEFVRQMVNGCFTWSSSDRFASGIPDFFILIHGKFVAVEAKFVKTLPKRKTSYVLSHPVSAAQKAFLEKVKENGGTALVVIGTPQAFIIFDEIKLNYTLEECLKAKRFSKNGCWYAERIYEFWEK